MKKYKESRNEKGELQGYIRNSDKAFIVEGNSDYNEVQKWITSGNTPDVDDTLLDKVKKAKIAEYEDEGVRRIALQVSEWKSFDNVAFVASIWNMLGSPNVAQTEAKNIYLYVKNTAISNVNAQVDIADVQAIDATNDPGWPV